MNEVANRGGAERLRLFYSSAPLWLLATVAASAITYLCSLDNGFITDDFIMLNRIELLKTNRYALIEATPEIFRLTSYGVMAGLKALFAYDYRPFYVFNILLHAMNSLLLGKLVFELMGKIQVAFLASMLFAVFQAPQEAVMWIGAMNETLLTFFLLLTLLLWIRGRHVLSLVTYLVALWSKESAPVILVIIPLVELYRGNRDFWRRYLLLLIPTAIFAASFALTFSKNFMVNTKVHTLQWHAVVVLIKSLHGLVWPWAYIFIILLRIINGRWPSARSTAVTIALLVTTLLPYIFVNYFSYVSSRHTYMASAVLMAALAVLMLEMDSRPLRVIAVASFLLFNPIYVWVRKDRLMELRAAPTTALLQQLRPRSPGPVRLVGFEYAPYAELARAAAITLPGWQWNDIELVPPAGECAACLVLEWDRRQHVYIVK